MSKLRQAFREHAALLGVQSDYGSQLDEDQKKDLRDRIGAAKRASVESLGPAYSVTMQVEGSAVEEVVLADARPIFAEHLQYLWKVLVEEEEWILRRVGSVTMRNCALVPNGSESIRVKDAVDAFLRFTDKPIIASRHAVTSGLAQACQDGVVGVGRGTTPANLQARYCKKTVSLDPNEDGVWIIPPFEPELPKQQALDEETGIRKDVLSIGLEGEGAGVTEPEDKRVQTKPTSVSCFRVRGAVPMEDWGELFRCFVRPAATMGLKHMRLGIEFEMEAKPESPLSMDDAMLKAMKEAAQQLGLKLEIE